MVDFQKIYKKKGNQPISIWIHEYMMIMQHVASWTIHNLKNSHNKTQTEDKFILRYKHTKTTYFIA